MIKHFDTETDEQVINMNKPAERTLRARAGQWSYKFYVALPVLPPADLSSFSQHPPISFAHFQGEDIVNGE
jgi:hypothetical protein